MFEHMLELPDAADSVAFSCPTSTLTFAPHRWTQTGAFVIDDDFGRITIGGLQASRGGGKCRQSLVASVCSKLSPGPLGFGLGESFRSLINAGVSISGLLAALTSRIVAWVTGTSGAGGVWLYLYSVDLFAGHDTENPRPSQVQGKVPNLISPNQNEFSDAPRGLCDP